jgi:precorrin-6A synthase
VTTLIRQNGRVRKIYVVGIGAGDPEHLTLGAVRVIAQVDAFFLMGKGDEKDSMIALRRDIISSHASGRHRVVEGRDPARDRTPADYTGTVADWRSRRADVTAELLAALGPEETGAFLVWGDPSLYDSTIAILDDLLDRGLDFAYEVIPGISSVSALAARHRIGLNRVGRPVQVTTGRRLAEGLPEGVDDVVVMLDAQQTFRRYATEDIDIYWGAYLGTPDEITIAGPLSEVAEQISAVRQEARDRHGWIMDTYLLRRHDTGVERDGTPTG